MPPLLGFAAYSGTGKTTLLKALIPILKQRGLRIGVIKHSHHDVEVDQPGKDSYELRKAGAVQTLLASPHRLVKITELDGGEEAPPLASVVERLDLEDLDLVIVEGYRHERLAKIELHRPALHKPLIHPHDDAVIAIATDAELRNDGADLPLLDLNDPSAVADFVLAWLARQASTSA